MQWGLGVVDRDRGRSEGVLLRRARSALAELAERDIAAAGDGAGDARQRRVQSARPRGSAWSGRCMDAARRSLTIYFMAAQTGA